ncbi:hypothetical protein ACNO8X_14505 [Mycobacterium sp. PDNC021]|uniref:hypothetical protein n=1 Tax=Mycobacterium sp. PDNC021 TaxID=3391399 RepID=UPI003AAC3D6F
MLTNHIKPMPFVKLYQFESKELAKDETLPPYLRAFFLAISRAQPNRHAEFKRGELAKLLGKNRKRNAHLDSTIGRAVEYGLLHRDSIPRCLVLTNLVDLFDKYGVGARSCRTHGGTPRPSFPASCHPDKAKEAHGLCDACYRREIRTARAQGRAPWWDEPEPIDTPELERLMYLDSVAADEPPDWDEPEPEMLAPGA